MTQQVPVEMHAWPGNAKGLRKLTVPTAARFIRKRIHDPRFRARAGQVLRDAGFPKTVKAKCEALRLHCKATTDYAPDPLMSEMVVDPEYTGCFEGAAMCMPIADCDDETCFVLSLIGAAGMDVRILLLEFGSGAQAHLLGAAQDEKGAWLEVDVTTDKPTGYVSWAKTRTLIDPFDPKMMELGEFVGGAFVGAGRASAIVPVMDPALRLLGAGAVTPGDVLAYRAMWNAYVVQTACALSVQAWAAGVQATTGTPPTTIDFTQAQCECAGDVTPTDPNAQGWGYNVTSGIFDTSSFAQQPPSAALLNTFAQASADQAQALLDQWNNESGLTDAQIVQAAPQILGSLQDIVVQCGRVFRPALVSYSPGLATAIAAGPDTSLQTQVIARIEGAGITARGQLGILETGVGGVIVAAKKAVGDAGKVALSPWLWGAIGLIAASAATIAVVYVYKTSTAPASLARAMEAPKRLMAPKKKKRKYKRAA